MTKFCTKCVERNWHGGCVKEEFACDTNQRRVINAALTDICNKLNNCTLRGISKLISTLNSKKKSVCFNCEGCSYDAYINHLGGDRITVCNRSFSSYTQNRMNAIIFHELVHAAGGTELDAEAFENHCYRGQGATAPTSDDFSKFRREGGTWVNWDRKTGNVTLKSNGQELNVNKADFVDPSGGGDGGGWF